MKIGFDNEKYLKIQSEHIRERIAQFDGKLYMELGGKLGVALVPGEIEPAILWGGAASAAESWNGESWDYAPLAKTCGAERLICFGLCNDQAGYILCDNDYRSMLTENEEINAVSSKVGSQMTEAFEALISDVKNPK